jgi:hypothetical protein
MRTSSYPKQNANNKTLAAARIFTQFIALILLLCTGSVPAAHASAAATTTTLSVAPANNVAAGTVVTLAASVANPAPVTAGSVMFCDATASSCSGPAILGNVQLTSGGTATMRLRFGVGAHQIKAVFIHTNANLASSSATQTITVTGNASYVTSLGLTATGAPGNYTLTSQLVAYGQVSPTGTVSFLDASNGNASIATAPTLAAAPPQTMAVLGAPFAASNTAYGSFVPSSSTQLVGPQTWSIAVGDFNNDGIPDLVSAGVNDGLLSVMIGNGNGTFKPRVTYQAPLGSDPSTVVIADFNHDGKQDLAVVNGYGGTETLSIFLGNGDSTFQPQVTYNAGIDPVGLVAGDFNGDGFVDLVAVDRANDTVNVMLGNGDGTFQPMVTYPVGNLPYAGVIGDFDGDGNLDLAVNNSDDGTVSILFGNGDGTFRPQVTYNVGTAPRSLAVGDFNGDGVLDLAVTNFGDNTVTILLGKSDHSGGFQVQAPVLATGTNPAGIAVGDFNGDGVTDLVVTNFGDNTFSVFLGKGDGTFKPQVAFTGNLGNSPYPVAVGDFDGDGTADLAIANYNDQSASILLGVHAETLAATNVSATGPGTHNIRASYPGDTVYAGSNSITVPLVGLLGTTTVVTSSAESVPNGTPFTFTATVTATTGTPTGTVSFYDSTTLLGTAPVSSTGVATFSHTLSAGTHSVTATYTGDSSYNASTSAAISVTVTVDTDFVVGSAQQTGMVNPGGKVSFAIVVVSVNGAYNAPVALTAVGLPAGATATFSPNSATPGDNSATSILTVQMPAKMTTTSVIPSSSTPTFPLGLLPIASVIAGMSLLAIARMAGVIGAAVRPRQIAVWAATIVLGALVMSGVSGCRGGFITTPPQSFAITVTGTSGAQAHSTTVMLTVR